MRAGMGNKNLEKGGLRACRPSRRRAALGRLCCVSGRCITADYFTLVIFWPVPLGFRIEKGSGNHHRRDHLIVRPPDFDVAEVAGSLVLTLARRALRFSHLCGGCFVLLGAHEVPCACAPAAAPAPAPAPARARAPGGPAPPPAPPAPGPAPRALAALRCSMPMPD